MKKQHLFLGVLFVLSFAVLLSAQAAEESAGVQAAAVQVNNHVCPVMKEPIPEGQEVTAEYQGKIYRFCCPMCVKKFLANPEPYIKWLEEHPDAGK